jgi:hypothetical protein
MILGDKPFISEVVLSDKATHVESQAKYSSISTKVPYFINLDPR